MNDNNRHQYDPARARAGDPSTSHEAAASVRESSSQSVRDEILRVLRAYGPLSDEQISYQVIGVKSSPSGLRTRRSELVKAGLVEMHKSTGRTFAGRRCMVWRVVETGRLF